MGTLSFIAIAMIVGMLVVVAVLASVIHKAISPDSTSTFSVIISLAAAVGLLYWMKQSGCY